MINAIYRSATAAQTVPAEAPPDTGLRESQARYTEAIRRLEVKREQVRDGINRSLEPSLRKLQGSGNSFDRKLSFMVMNDIHQVVVRVIDGETNEVIRQIPPEEMLHLMEEIQKTIGNYVDRRG
jgi:flagellar protein FlaG